MIIKIQIALSNHILCEGVKRLISEGEVGAICNDSREGLQDFNADIVLFDSKQSITNLIQTYSNAKFILIDTGLKDVDLACLLLCHHISGIIPQDADLEGFCKAIQVVQKGEIWIDQKQLKTLINRGKSLPDGGGVKGLSPQDKKIVHFIRLGCKNSEIAESLCLSEPTIKAHVSKIYRMLKVKNRAQLICLAQDNEIEEP